MYLTLTGITVVSTENLGENGMCMILETLDSM